VAAAGFVDLLFDLFVPARCLSCGASLSSPDPDGPHRIPRRWPPETAEFLRTSFAITIGGGIAVPARVLCPSCWLDLDPAPSHDELSVCGPAAHGARAQAPSPGDRHPCSGRREVHIVTPFHTNDALLEIVHFLKFSSGRTAAPPLSWWLALSLSRYIERYRHGGFTRPLVVPVPLHPSRRRSRGYNQSALLARHTAARAGLEMDQEALRRIRKTKPQANLEPEDRTDNVRGAFELADAHVIRGRNVILIDDLVTSGETTRACAAALRRGRPASVTVLAVGRPRRFRKLSISDR
jgi:ComF family protein